jgi:hypothetical protein
MAKIHNGLVNNKLRNTFKDTGLNDFDLATTKVYKGVKPMFEHLGFINSNFDKPDEQIYWKNYIPSDYNYFNLSGIEVRKVEMDSDVGVSTGAKTTRESYSEIFIDEDVEQVWDNNHYYPVLPPLNKFGVFDEEVDVTLYGGENPPITNLNEDDDNLIFNLDLNQSDTDGIIDKTGITKVDYNQDFELKLDDNLRLFKSTESESDPIETDKSEQAF